MVSHRAYRDRDFVSTPEGLLFCVVGNVHPKDRVIAYLKYMPHEEGRWGREKRYARVLESYTTPSVQETLRMLEDRYPGYLYRSKALSMRISAVPLRFVETHYKPEVRLAHLLASDRTSLDPLEKKAVDFVKIISGESGVDTRLLGVTGSILPGIHNPAFSDIDLVVYGRENTLQLKETMKGLYKKSVAHRFNGPFLDEWAVRKSKQFPVSPSEAKEFYNRAWNRGIFKGTLFSIHPVKLEEEVKERFGERRFVPKGITTIRAKVTDVSDSAFLPATYCVDSVTVLDGTFANDIVEVSSYDGFYCDLFKDKEFIEAKGKLENVIDSKREVVYHRVLVGSFEAHGEDYVKPLNRQEPSSTD